MAGIVDALLGGALGFSSGLVQNAKQQQQTEAEEAKETRRLGREAFLMELRSKYNQKDADHANTLELGRMDKQGSIARDNAKYQSDLQLNALSDPRTVAAEKRKTDSEKEMIAARGAEERKTKGTPSAPQAMSQSDSFRMNLIKQYAAADDEGKAALIKNYPSYFTGKDTGSYELKEIPREPNKGEMVLPGSSLKSPVLYNAKTGDVKPLVMPPKPLMDYFAPIKNATKEEAQQMIASAKSQGWSDAKIRSTLQALGLK